MHAVLQDEVIVVVTPHGAHDRVERELLLEGYVAAVDVDRHVGVQPSLATQVSASEESMARAQLWRAQLRVGAGGGKAAALYFLRWATVSAVLVRR